ncbi:MULTISPECIES: DUF3188 domain-containing protein [unclassified Cyanobium]|uniref:DUF3188 domain-containing protein n=1 Tax=unclassified Cyanobium TaxID=2627006 RepID=UPI0020CFB5CB|nr:MULTISPECIES: DUF3188 domain-containing protein [unclassified Cyanobium]MCP9834472.1 DUF3188 domain-containing protein [Cyanobium sp. La Preciosa 7G6]MCP9937156.1 DUF3188 domain-containing protein [Cyanobium sp. Aljojuca 7A6]
MSVRRAPRFLAALLALSAPLLILLALLALITRQGADRLAALPALVIGCGLLGTSMLRRRRRRAELLRALREGPQA